MSDDHDPGSSPDPFEGLPEPLREMFEQMGGEQLFAGLQQMFSSGGFGGASTGPVDWNLARRIAIQLADEDDRDPTPEEERVANEAFGIAELWLDEGSLPAPPDAGRLEVSTRAGWAQAALEALTPLVDPVAAASMASMAELARQQMDGGALEQLGLGDLGGLFANFDPAAMLAPMGAMMAGMQAGQVIGQLSTQMLGQFDKGIPTAGRSRAFHVAVNVSEAFEGWELDLTEVAIVLALHEGAQRRLFHAVEWLESHIARLVAQFAEGMEVDPERLERMSRDLLGQVDPEDPASLERAMAAAADLTIEPTPAQQRTLGRLQALIGLVQAWARAEVDRAAADRLPNRVRIEEVLARRRATTGEGDRMLKALLGLDLRPPDDAIGDAFVAHVEAKGGPQALHRALAHPENLPDGVELADPDAWLARLAPTDTIPDDLGALFEGLGEAPAEPSAEERLARGPVDPDDPTDEPPAS